jgi:hypothetical protein
VNRRLYGNGRECVGIRDSRRQMSRQAGSPVRLKQQWRSPCKCVEDTHVSRRVTKPPWVICSC